MGKFQNSSECSKVLQDILNRRRDDRTNPSLIDLLLASGSILLWADVSILVWC